MCQHVLRGQIIYATPRQLSNAIGGVDGLVWMDHEDEMDWCLCTIDIPSTLDRAKLNWKRDHDPLIFIIEE